MDETQIVPLYFGCMGDAGHYVFDIHGRKVSWKSKNPGAQFLEKHDGQLTPNCNNKQGAYLVHKYPEFTVVACHDYTVDSRGGSNSMFLIPGQLDDQTALTQARALFPQIWARMEKG